MSSDHVRFDQLAAGFALSSLEPEDEFAFRAHLPGCERCAEALLEHSTTMGHLAYAASSEEPPASVLEGIRAGLRASGADGLRPIEAPSSLEVARSRRSGRTVRLSTALVGIAASVVVALALVIAGGGFSGSEPKSADLALSELVSHLTGPGARVVDLKGDGHAVAVINNGHVSLAVQGMAVNNRTSNIYVLWGKSRYGGVRAVGTFDVSTTKAAAINDLGTVTPGTLELLLVTKEEGRRAPAVTTQQPVMTGQV